jgi:hypothetical protein
MREDLSLKHNRLYGTEDSGEFEPDKNNGKNALYAGAGRWKGKCRGIKATKLFTATQSEQEQTKLKVEM